MILTSRNKPIFQIATLISFIIIPTLILLLAVANNDTRNFHEKEIITTEEITTTKPTTTKVTTTTASITKHHDIKHTTTKEVTTKHSVTTKHNSTKHDTTKVSSQQSTSNNIDTGNKYYSESDITLISKVLYSECRGISSKTQKACVVWVICNRVDSGYGSTISSVVLQKNQFAYNPNSPVNSDLYNLAKDVLERWSREKNGETNVGRVLPKNYLYFHGDGRANYFKTNSTQPYKVWDYSLPSPYNN